jgi:hypothetical protein
VNQVIEALKTKDVVLYVHSGAFKRNEEWTNGTGTHYIHISSIELVGDQYKVTYWNYGITHVPVYMDAFQFWNAVYGINEIPRAND